VLAVYIPPQAPAAGQEFLTISMCFSSQMDSPTYSSGAQIKCKNMRLQSNLHKSNTLQGELYMSVADIT
jgi:hypothetical protein